MDANRLQPAFYGGLVIGILSALPIVNAGNCCCCLWVISGGVLAVYLRQQNLPHQIQASEGALMGLLAGAIGGVIWAVVAIPMQALTAGMMSQWVERILASNPDIPPELRDRVQQLALGSAARVVGTLVNFCVSVAFGLIGGLLGVAIFKKNAPPPPPPGTIDVVPPPPMAPPPMAPPPPPIS